MPETECPEIDATGLYVAPGFIDIHSHSDYTLLVDPRAMSAIYQGVTLEVVGNCGFGCFPIRDGDLARKAIYGYSDEVPIEWSSAGGYFDRLQTAKPAVNVLSLVPNGQLRLSTVGLADRPADPAELADMKQLLEESLAEGAWGYSTGLEYAQEAGATENEVADLCRVLARGGGLYATHTRRRDEGATDSVAEAIRVATASEVRLQVSHLVPRNGIEESRRSADLVEAARARGLDVEFDMHTRLYGLTHLYAALPPWALAEEPAALAELLRDPSARDRMRPHRSILSAGDNWGRIVLLDNPFWPEYARRDLASIAAERGQAPLDTVYDLLSGALDAPHKLMVIIHAYTEEEQREAFAHPLCVPARMPRRSLPTARCGHLVPRGLHLGVLVLPFHGARRGPAQPRGGRAQAERAARRAAGPLRSWAAPAWRSRRRDGLRPGALRRARHDLRAEPARRRRSPRPRQRRAHATRGRADR